jgi:peptidoglycan/xylan/chitin deacetylase (PgdA/CDA1 family)
VAVTFDDGPNPPYTGQVVEILRRYGVPATFFCIGLNVAGYPDDVVGVQEAGHRVGNHTWSHPFLPDLRPPEVEAQFDRTAEAIGAVATRPPESLLFRPPYGARTAELLSWISAERPDHTLVLWDVDSYDWAQPGADTIVDNVMRKVQPGSIILMHDGGGDRSQTVAALPRIIEGLMTLGYRFVLLGELREMSVEA